MAITNSERVGKALDHLQAGLQPFVEREMKSKHGAKWEQEIHDILNDTRLASKKGQPTQDVAVLLVIMDRTWTDIFKRILGKAERSLVNELLDIRNKWAHQHPFSTDLSRFR
jgi:hypothetical protein